MKIGQLIAMSSPARGFDMSAEVSPPRHPQRTEGSPPMSLRINNETNWDGRHLRTLCKRVIDATDGHYHRTIDIKTSRSRGKERAWEFANEHCDEQSTVATTHSMYRGYASLGSRRKLYMGVPKVERKVNGEWLRHKFDVVQFARVMEHEVLHNQGLRHGDMVDATRYCSQDVDHMDLDGVTVEPKPSFEFQGEYE